MLFDRKAARNSLNLHNSLSLGEKQNDNCQTANHLKRYETNDQHNGA